MGADSPMLFRRETLTARAYAFAIENEGAYTSQVADALGVTMAQAYRALKRAERRGGLFGAGPWGPGETFWMVEERSA